MRQYDITGIGNPLLDIVVRVEDAFLEQIGFTKSEMRLVSEHESKQLLAQLKNKQLLVGPGGGAANTVSGVGLLGGKGVFMGMVGDDEHAKTYEQGLVHSRVDPYFAISSLPTGYALTFITPDGERTFATYLGASLGFRSEHVSAEHITQSKVLHVEGYQLEGEQQHAAERAMQIAQQHGVRVSLSLADSHLIQRVHTDMKRFVEEYVDVLFLNEDEAVAYTTKPFSEALGVLSKEAAFVAVTRSEQGSVLLHEGTRIDIAAERVPVTNTNGAGDAYATGVLYGLAQGMPAEQAGRLGSVVAAEVVQNTLARPQRPLGPGVAKAFKDANVSNE